MPNKPNLIGQTFGRLTVVSAAGINNTRAMWNCACDCGKTTTARTSDLRSGDVASCGCLLRGDTAANRKHGHSSRANGCTPTYNSWRGMIERCCNTSHISYAKYGGRGIKICERWKAFDAFLQDMGERQAGESIDRIDNDGNYQLDNCRWATAKEQRHNRSDAAGDQTMSWTEERVESLKQLWSDGLSASQIAREIGDVTRNGVIGKIHRLGLMGRGQPLIKKKKRKPTVVVFRASLRASPALPQFPVAPLPVRPASAEEPTPRMLPLEELTTFVCRYPIGDPDCLGFGFCGLETQVPPYCAYHAAICYRENPARGARAGRRLKSALGLRRAAA